MQKLNNNRTYSEMYAILDALGEEYINRIPKKLYNLICEQRDFEYTPNLMTNKGILNESLISRETLALFAVLNTQYFMKTEEEKQEYMRILKNNEREYQIEQMQKYNPENLFRKNEDFEENSKEQINKSETSLVEYKESIFSKIINKIKGFFRK